MTWLAALVKGLFEALLPFVFKKGPTVAEDAKQVDVDLRRSWASRINARLRELEPESRDDPSDPVG